MAITQDKLFYRGNYRKYDPNGKLNIYDIGDVVEFQGKRYVANKILKDSLPSTKNSGWDELEVAPRFYNQVNEPAESNEGDRWLDKSSGILYGRVQDNTGYHWVEF